MNISAPLAPSSEWLTTLMPFVDPIAVGIVLGGTILTVVLRSPAADLWRAAASLPVLFRRSFTADALLDQAVALTRIARRHGVMALDRSVIDDADLAFAVAHAVDNKAAAQLELLLEQRQAARTERHAAAAGVWESAAEAAPAMGMVGTLIGLVSMFLKMDDVSAIGGAMAIALLTTLYGAIVANLVAAPIGARLRRRAAQEARERQRLIAPLVAIADIGRARAPVAVPSAERAA